MSASFYNYPSVLELERGGVIIASNTAYSAMPLVNVAPQAGDVARVYQPPGNLQGSITVVAIVAGIVALRYIRFPGLVAVIAFAAWFFSMDAAEAIFGANATGTQRALFGIGVGLALMGIAMRYDHRQERSYALWLHLFGLMSMVSAFCYLTLDTGHEALWALVGVLSIVAIFMSVLLVRKVYLVFGTVGVFSWLTHLAYVTTDGAEFPAALVVVGLIVLFVGLAVGTRTDDLRASLLRSLPDWARGLVPEVGSHQ